MLLMRFTYFPVEVKVFNDECGPVESKMQRDFRVYCENVLQNLDLEGYDIVVEIKKVPIRLDMD